jgi:hypothetical protein
MAQASQTSLMAKTPYPIRDWRNAALYPQAETEGVPWRWEFLRRHPDYQSFYGKHAGRDLTRTERAHVLVQFGAERFDDPMLDATPASTPTTSDGATVPSATGRDVGGVEFIGSPGATIRPERMAFWIDRTLPLTPQLDKIRRAVAEANAVENTTPSMANANRSAWPDYLRILDARAAEATFDEIAASIYPLAPNTYPEYKGRDRARYAHKQAMNLLRDFAIGQFKGGK